MKNILEIPKENSQKRVYMNKHRYKQGKKMVKCLLAMQALQEGIWTSISSENI